jgi:hypothetical protein
MRKSLIIGLGLAVALGMALVLASCAPATVAAPAAPATAAGAATTAPVTLPVSATATVPVSPTAAVSSTAPVLPAGTRVLSVTTPVVTGTVSMTPTLAVTGQQAEVVAAAKTYLAKQLGISTDAISLVSITSVEWPDSCLGVQEPGIMCSMIVTPGYRVILQAPNAAGQPTQYEIHTNLTGESLRMATPKSGAAGSAAPTGSASTALVWQRSGGFAGICQKLTVNLDWTYVLENCKSNQVVSQGPLPLADAGKVADVVTRYGSIAWQPTPTLHSADMFNDQLTLYGRGTNAATSTDVQSLDAYLGQLANQLAKPGGTPAAPSAGTPPAATPPAAQTPASAQASGTGIEGVAVMGPTCPVARAWQACADKPIQLTLAILEGKTVVKQVQTGADGRFKVNLPPGVYTVQPQTSAPYPRGSQQVTVVSGQYAPVKVTLDSGIR